MLHPKPSRSSFKMLGSLGHGCRDPQPQQLHTKGWWDWSCYASQLEVSTQVDSLATLFVILPPQSLSLSTPSLSPSTSSSTPPLLSLLLPSAKSLPNSQSIYQECWWRAPTRHAQHALDTRDGDDPTRDPRPDRDVPRGSHTNTYQRRRGMEFDFIKVEGDGG